MRSRVVFDLNRQLDMVGISAMDLLLQVLWEKGQRPTRWELTNRPETQSTEPSQCCSDFFRSIDSCHTTFPDLTLVFLTAMPAWTLLTCLPSLNRAARASRS